MSAIKNSAEFLAMSAAEQEAVMREATEAMEAIASDVRSRFGISDSDWDMIPSDVRDKICLQYYTCSRPEPE